MIIAVARGEITLTKGDSSGAIGSLRALGETFEHFAVKSF
jgi:hypothetical protein